LVNNKGTVGTIETKETSAPVNLFFLYYDPAECGIKSKKDSQVSKATGNPAGGMRSSGASVG
jgi:hypothetical protein